MKVLFAGAILSPHWTGGEPQIAKSLITELKQNENMEIESFYIRRKSLGANISRICNSTDLNLFLYRKYIRFIEKSKPDIIIGWYDWDSTLYAAALKKKIPIICVVQIYWPICPALFLRENNKNCLGIFESHYQVNCLNNCLLKKNKFMSVLRLFFNNNSIYLSFKKRRILLNRINGIITAGEYVKSRLIKAGFCAEKIKVIPNAIDLNEFNPDKDVINNNIVLNFTASCQEEKGFSDFVKLAEMIKKDFPQLRCVSTGAKPQNFDNANIDFTGYINKSEIMKILSKSFVVIVPSKWEEPFGLVNIEAMAMKKPVIAYHSGSIPEIIRDGFNGFLIENGNIEGIFERIGSLLKDNHLHQEIGTNARRTIEAKYDIKRIAQEYYAVIKETIANSNYRILN